MTHKSNHRDHSNDADHQEEIARQQSEHRWSTFLNQTLGMLGFPLGLTCLSTKTPSLNGLLCLVFLMLIWLNNRRLIPKHFRETSRNKTFAQLRRSSAKFWMSTSPALLGYVYLFFVTFSQPIAKTCTSHLQCQWFADGVTYYVGAPKPDPNEVDSLAKSR